MEIHHGALFSYYLWKSVGLATTIDALGAYKNNHPRLEHGPDKGRTIFVG